MKKIVVNDTKVLIDLIDIGLLDEFFYLPWEVHTTEFVLSELSKEGLRDYIYIYKKNGLLHIPIFDEPYMSEALEIYLQLIENRNVSLTDYIGCYYAKRNNYMLLISDRKPSYESLIDGIEVHNIIYVICQLVEKGFLDKLSATSKLKLLGKSNPRLPKNDIGILIKQWEKGNKMKGGCL